MRVTSFTQSAERLTQNAEDLLTNLDAGYDMPPVFFLFWT